MFGLATRIGTSASGRGVVIWTVDSSVAVTFEITSALNARAGTSTSSRWVSAPATASASIGVPSWKVTPSRSVNSQVLVPLRGQHRLQLPVVPVLQ